MNQFQPGNRHKKSYCPNVYTVDLGDYNPGQWEWKPPTTTTTETTFIETSPIQEPLSGDFKVRNVF